MSYQSRAVTLTEVLISISVISLLFGLLAPALIRGRSLARGVVSTAEVRSLATAHAVYAQESADMLFYPGVPNSNGIVIKWRDGVLVDNPFFVYALSWRRYMDLSDAETTSPFRPRPNLGEDFPVTCTSFTKPGYWDRRTRRGDRAQWTGVGLNHVTFPARKSWLHDEYRFSNSMHLGSEASSRWIAAFFDGSAAASAHAGEFYYNGDGVLEGGFHNVGESDGAHTIGGVSGTDR